jgi:hypothetical protein
MFKILQNIMQLCGWMRLGCLDQSPSFYAEAFEQLEIYEIKKAAFKIKVWVLLLFFLRLKDLALNNGVEKYNITLTNPS